MTQEVENWTFNVLPGQADRRSEGKMLWQTMQWILCRMGAIRALWC